MLNDQQHRSWFVFSFCSRCLIEFYCELEKLQIFVSNFFVSLIKFGLANPLGNRQENQANQIFFYYYYYYYDYYLFKIKQKLIIQDFLISLC